MSVDDRIAAGLTFRPEMCSLNMGSMNFGLYPALARYARFEREWERPYLEASRAISSETPSPISSRSSTVSARTARDSSSSATTSATCTISRTFSNAA